MSYVQIMCKGKPDRYKKMVQARVDKANEYANKAGGRIASRQVVAIIMLMVDDIYVEGD